MPTSDREIFVEIQHGKLRGCIQRSCFGDEYFAFKGIPYAKPPVGPLRFRDPEPVEPWSGVRDATQYGSMCLQYLPRKDNQLRGSEDCLYLNIFARKIDPHLRQPVLVWIHGGGFLKLSGDDNCCGPDYYMKQEDFVFVTINYRLGVFGFLNLENEVATGNQGLKDQLLTLQWVRENISCFGGDPGNVTIAGGSAGAVSVHFLTLSPLATGLFHKAIFQSGCALNPWVMKQGTQKSMDDFLALLEYDKERDPKTVIEFLRGVDSYKLAKAQQKLTSPLVFLQMNSPFGPCVDDKSSKPFLPVHPAILAEKGVQVPLLVGHTSFEGIFFKRYIDDLDNKEIDRDVDKYISGWISDMLRRYDFTLEDFKKMYFRSKQNYDQYLTKVLEVYSDAGFVEGIHKLLEIQVHKSGAPTYFYKFSYHKYSTPYEGARHGDDVTYQLKVPRFEENNMQQLEDGTSDVRIMEQVMELWINFVKTGRPTPSTSELVPLYWLPVANDVVLRYLDIDEELRMKKDISIVQRYASFKNPP